MAELQVENVEYPFSFMHYPSLLNIYDKAYQPPKINPPSPIISRVIDALPNVMLCNA